MEFKVVAEDGRARAGVMQTAHGEVRTPVFMPVGTVASVKSLTPEDLHELGAQIILGNTYHLYLRPGCEVIDRFAGLHRFMHWHRPILTDSGGFQVFSLAKLREMAEEGVTFQSHLDGSRHLLTPEGSVAIQACLGADILMCLDECIPYPASAGQTEAALSRTTRWASRCKSAWEENGASAGALFGIVQGGMDKALRERSVEELTAIGFPGYAIGGLSVGEPKQVMYDIAGHTLPLLPGAAPRYVMGVGAPEDLVTMVAMGADMFDCVLPTRNARNGQLFTQKGPVNIKNARFRLMDAPVDEGCTCYTCRNFSAAYLRHLFLSRELLSYRLNTIHNLHFFITLMAKMRQAIIDGDFSSFQQSFHGAAETSGLGKPETQDLIY